MTTSNVQIDFDSINIFTRSTRQDNDDANKLREKIIRAIINKEIPDSYYNTSNSTTNNTSNKWNSLRDELHTYMQKLCSFPIDHIHCELKGGRKFHWDFEFTINYTHIFNIEFKFGVDCVEDCPQFSSPMKPSRFFNRSFEEYFHDKWLPKIATFGNLKMPSKDTYLQKIHNNKVECMKDYKTKYDTDTSFNKYCKQIDKLAIKEFIKSEETKLDISLLSAYLKDTQKKKIYMCYNNGHIYKDTVNRDCFELKRITKTTSTNIICETNKGYKIEVKLRFKNGCGLQFPAFQIKRKIPYKKELIELCKKHGIPYSGMVKKDIQKKLDDKNIIY